MVDRFGAARVIEVRRGHVASTSSCIYVWIDTTTREIVYVGATGIDPAVRTHLHLSSDDPDVARVKTTVPSALQRQFDVLVFDLPESVSRSEVKSALVAVLEPRAAVPSPDSDEGALTVCRSIVSTLAAYRAQMTR